MKKYIAAILALVVVILSFTACSKGLKDGQLLSDGNQNYAALTEKDGNLVRDDAGQLVVLVTNERGEQVTKDDGSLETTAVGVSHAVTHGDKIEYSSFSITLPKGWRPGNSYDEINIWSEDKSEHIVIYSSTSKTLEQEDEKVYGLFGMVLQAKGVSATKTDTITLAGVEAKRIRADFDDDEIKSMIYYSFEGGRGVYGVLCYATEEKTDNSVFEEVLNTMVLY